MVLGVLVLAACGRTAVTRPQPPAMPDSGTPPDAGVDSDPCTFESLPQSDHFVEVAPDSWWLAPPPLTVGCVHYAVSVHIYTPRDQTPEVWHMATEYRVCHRCAEPEVMRWVNHVPVSDHLSSDPDTVGQVQPRVDFVLTEGRFPDVLAELHDQMGGSTPAGCAWLPSTSCYPAGPSVTHQVQLDPGEILYMSQDPYLVQRPAPSGGLPLFYDWRRDWADYVDGGTAPIFNYDSDMSIGFELPHLWPASTPTSQGRPEAQNELACIVDGFPHPDWCQAFVLDPGEWTRADLLELNVDTPLPPPLLDALKARASAN